MADILMAVATDGFAMVERVLDQKELDALLDVLEDATAHAGIRRRGGVLAIRNLLEAVPEVADLARSPALRALAESVTAAPAFAVRGILFDKTPATNWKVTWHQDLTIAVRERREVEGFGPWSVKAGVASVQPPVAVLENMVTIRINLDACGPENGPLRLLPGSHLAGRLGPDDIAGWRARVAEVLATGPAGAALVMRPLLLYASSPATTPAHRRVIHLDYACEDLPEGLEWYTRV
jgi:ectoine hydroxylase-related dioxygenase (phytanoyl-CoA dioxygenase family)